ncbi:hypothetical protein C0993_007418 [Termitomyces sp. T159_Od127]|nr:hypothetical protein C0993_007418 [Termitomyces sp. T159_Od127]
MQHPCSLPASPLTSPIATPALGTKNLDKENTTTSPDIPLSEMPTISTQEQLLIETSVIFDQQTSEKNNNKTNQVEGGEDSQGLQVVTLKKSKKKAKKALKRLQDLNKRPHSDSPLKERNPKQMAIDPENTQDESGHEGQTNSPCPSPTLSLSQLGCKDMILENFLEGEDSLPSNITPKAREDRSRSEKQAKSRQTMPNGQTHSTPKGDPTRTPKNDQKPPKNRAQNMYGGTPMSVTEPPLTPEANDGTQDEVVTQHEVDEDKPKLWFETTQNNITTNGKSFKRTATPIGGWPKVYLAASPSYNVAPDMLNKWEDLEEPTLWACLYQAKYEASVAGKMKTEDAIKNVIKT